jgi:hypothetical protein
VDGTPRADLVDMPSLESKSLRTNWNWT